MQKQKLKQSQKFKLSKEQIQFLGLLQIPLIALEKRIEEELEKNPALEEEEEENNDIHFTKNKRSNKHADIVIPEKEETLHEFLISQIPLHNLNDQQKLIAEFLIGCVDNNGFLKSEIFAISEDLFFNHKLTASEEEIIHVLKIVHEFDPAGVGAKDLQECLLLQLNRKKQTYEIKLAKNILISSYDLFKTKNFNKIKTKLNIDDNDLKKAFNEISKLNPKPGGNFTLPGDSTNYIIPDFTMNILDEKIKIELNKSYKGNLKVNKYYNSMLEGLKKENNKEAVDFLENKIDRANWFIDSLVKRDETLLKTINCIAKLQYDFFISGDFKHLKPMKLLDIAQKIDLDISTVSRVTNSKYIETPFGTFLIKDFFSEAFHKDDGTTISNKVIKEHLNELLENEDKRNPLTDEKLSEQLDRKGYHISRRTVAKYRQELNYVTARLRKEV